MRYTSLIKNEKTNISLFVSRLIKINGKRLFDSFATDFRVPFNDNDGVAEYAWSIRPHPHPFPQLFLSHLYPCIPTRVYAIEIAQTGCKVNNNIRYDCMQAIQPLIDWEFHCRAWITKQTIRALWPDRENFAGRATFPLPFLVRTYVSQT